MKIFNVLLISLCLAGATTGCAYGHTLRVGKKKVMITKNDGFLFGLLRKVHVCDVTDDGVENCSEKENP